MVSGAVIAAELSWQLTIGAIRSTGEGISVRCGRWLLGWRVGFGSVEGLPFGHGLPRRRSAPFVITICRRNVVHIMILRSIPLTTDSSLLFSALFYRPPLKTKHRLPKSLSAQSVPWRRSRGKTALFLNGVAYEQITQFSTTRSVVTGVEPSLDSKFTEWAYVLVGPIRMIFFGNHERWCRTGLNFINS